MNTQVTLTLPESIFRQVEAVARRARRPIADVLVDVVTDAFPRFYVSPERTRMEAEQQAYENQRDAILAAHAGEYVAVHGGQVVDHDHNEIELINRIQPRYPTDIVHIRLVTQEPQPELRFRSPRFVDTF